MGPLYYTQSYTWSVLVSFSQPFRDSAVGEVYRSKVRLQNLDLWLVGTLTHKNTYNFNRKALRFSSLWDPKMSFMHMRMPDLSEYDLYVIITSLPTRGCVIGVRPFTPEASPRHVLNVMELLSLIFSFFLLKCGFYRFRTNRWPTTVNNQHKYCKQSEIKSQNQESGSKTRGFDLSSSSSSWSFTVASHVPLDDR